MRHDANRGLYIEVHEATVTHLPPQAISDLHEASWFLQIGHTFDDSAVPFWNWALTPLILIPCHLA